MLMLLFLFLSFHHCYCLIIFILLYYYYWYGRGQILKKNEDQDDYNRREKSHLACFILNYIKVLTPSIYSDNIIYIHHISLHTQKKIQLFINLQSSIFSCIFYAFVSKCSKISFEQRLKTYNRCTFCDTI